MRELSLAKKQNYNPAPSCAIVPVGGSAAAQWLDGYCESFRSNSSRNLGQHNVAVAVRIEQQKILPPQSDFRSVE